MRHNGDRARGGESTFLDSNPRPEIPRVLPRLLYCYCEQSRQSPLRGLLAPESSLDMAQQAIPADPYDPRRTWLSPGFDVLSFIVSHLFLYPIPLLIAGLGCIAYGSTVARAVSLVCILGYAASMFDKAQLTGARAWLAFRRPWLGCHPYFPIVSSRSERVPLQWHHSRT